MECFDPEGNEGLLTVWSFHLGVLCARSVWCRDGCCADGNCSAGQPFAPYACRRAHARSPGALSRPVLTAASMAVVTTASPKTSWDARESGRGWISLVAGFVVGAALSFCAAQAGRAVSVPAAPADRQDAPPPSHSSPLRQTPYAPPIRIGSGAQAPISGATAPLRDSAVLRRNGELS